MVNAFAQHENITDVNDLYRKKIPRKRHIVQEERLSWAWFGRGLAFFYSFGIHNRNL